MPDRDTGTVAELDLLDGRRITVRDTRPDDIPALIGLFEGLPAEDIRCRFFTSQVPPRRLFERWIECAASGGLHLVAVVDDGRDPAHRGAGEQTIVAEAGYFPCDREAAEFAITVQPRWRGWFGPYLFDLLCRTAHDRGVANLEADVLATNSRMFALLRRRGYVTLDHEDYSVARVLIASNGGIPGWPDDHDRPRVLVEVPGGRWWAAAEIRRAGMRIVGCPGPGRCGTTCPALEGEPCPLVAGADVVVLALGPDDPAASALLAAHGRQRPDLPVFAHQDILTDSPTGARPARIALPERASAAELAAQVLAVSGARRPG